MSSQAMNKQEMNEQEQRKLADLLQRSLPPMNPELDRDLWPKMLQRIMLHRIMLHRIDERARDRHWLAVLFSPSALSAVPWFDWALLAVVIVGLCIFPRSIPIWLYHF
jgi:hypothetical protein